jgi:predicted ATPase
MPPASPPPIALTSLKIRNFRGIESLELDFRGPDVLVNNLVVLAGPNGSGKTAVLEAALVAVGGSKLLTGPCGKRAVRKGAEDYEIRAEIRARTNLYDEDDVVVSSSRVAPPKTDPRLPYWYFSSWRAPTLVGAVNVTVGKRGRRPAKTELNRLLNVKQQFANAAAAQSFPGSKPPAARNYSKWIARINDGWKTFYPDQSDEFAVGLTDSEEDGDGAFEVFYNRKSSPPLSVDDLSAGQLELFLFLAALVLNDDREGIVFIDEPELHLDPQWHAPIVRALMQLQPRAQFIVATHSPEIYDAAASYERHYLVPEDDPRSWLWAKQGAVESEV